MPPTNSLTATDWTTAALNALGQGGVQAIRVEAIARDLNVSKGSFYWHFKDVKALKAAMLHHWARHSTEDIIGKVDASGDSATDRLHHLVALSTGRRTQHEAIVEQAIRDWARYEQAAAAVLQEVDQRRIAYVADLFRATGRSQKESALAAELLYSGLIGLGYLGTTHLSNRQTALMRLLHLILSVSVPGEL